MNLQIVNTTSTDHLIHAGSIHCGYFRCLKCGVVKDYKHPICIDKLEAMQEDFKQEHESCNCPMCEVA